MRSGSSLKLIPKANLAERFQAKNCVVFMGDGPTSLQLTISGKKISEFAVTYRPNEYRFLEYKNGTWFSGSNVEFGRGFKSGVYESRLRHDELIQIVFVLLGFRDAKYQKLIAPILKDLLSQMAQNQIAS